MPEEASEMVCEGDHGVVWCPLQSAMRMLQAHHATRKDMRMVWDLHEADLRFFEGVFLRKLDSNVQRAALVWALVCRPLDLNLILRY